jgi:hypothetical protein
VLPTPSPVIDALRDLEEWFRGLPAFDRRSISDSGVVVGRFGPTILSEQDAILHTARLLASRGVPWDHLHLELAITKWLWEEPHPAVSLVPKQVIDLAIISPLILQHAHLPDKSGTLVFDAFLEFKYGDGSWQHGDPWGVPQKLRSDVEADVDKLGLCLDAGICRSAHVVCLEQVDYGFADDFVAECEARHPGRLHVHLIRAWDPE